MTIQLMPFTRHDWDCFAGVEPFDDGGDPLIGEIRIDQEPALIILDGIGIVLHWCVEREVYSVHARGSAAARLLSQLKPSMTNWELAALPGVVIERG